ncbi:MAG: hypothetical protein WED10_09445 [Brumimicrobium sp.]
MTDDNFKEMIDNLINKIVNDVKNKPTSIKEQLSDNIEIREALINSLSELHNELNTKIGDRFLMTSHNSTIEQRDEMENKIKKLNGQIQLRMAGIKDFYDKLISELEMLTKP